MPECELGSSVWICTLCVSQGVCMCLHMHSVFAFGLHYVCVYVCDCSGVFIKVQPKASSALPCLPHPTPSHPTPGLSHCLRSLCQTFEEIIVMFLPDLIWWLAELAPSVRSWSTASGNSHTVEPPASRSNQQSFTSKSCYLHQVGMSPGAKMAGETVAESGRKIWQASGICFWNSIYIQISKHNRDKWICTILSFNCKHS